MTTQPTDPKSSVDVAEQKAVETETTQSNSPKDEKPTTGAETTAEESFDQGSTEENPIESSMSEEQRRAFQEMRLENKRLKEEREAKPSESAFKVFRTQPQAGQGGPVRVEDYQDQITGETNWQAYNMAQQQREQAIIQQAKAEAQETVEERFDEERARSKYPDLFRDPITEKQIASRWLYEKVQGNNVPIEKIAEEFSRNFKQAVSKAEKISTERILNEVSEKEKAGLAAQTQSSQGAQAQAASSNYDDLVNRTRRGDEIAIAERISKIPWANK